MDRFIFSDRTAELVIEAALADMRADGPVSSVLLDGPPGVGKSFLGTKTAERIGATLIRYQFYPGCNEEDIIVPKTSHITGMKGVLPQAIESSHVGKTVLLLNEIDKVPAEMDHFLLDFLTEGELMVPKLGGNMKARKENLLVVITKNDARNVTEALMRRVRPVFFRWPEEGVEIQIIQAINPAATVDQARAMITLAHEIRLSPKIRKKPSSPELARILLDCGKILNQKNLDALEWGRYLVNALCPIKSEQEALSVTAVQLGTRFKGLFADKSIG